MLCGQGLPLGNQARGFGVRRGNREKEKDEGQGTGRGWSDYPQMYLNTRHCLILNVIKHV